MAIFRDPCTFEEAVVLNGSVTFADTPTEIVPRSTGWPYSWRSAMSATTASYFASLVL